MGRRIVVPLYGGQRDNPVLFDAGLFAELLQVTGDESGRGLLRRHPDEIAAVGIERVGASYDIDTWEAYQSMLQAWEQQ